MPVPGLTIHGHIDRVAASRGLAPTWEQKASIDSIVGTLADVADDGVRVEGLSLDAWIAGQLAGMNVARATSQPAPASSGTAGEPIVSSDGQHVLIHSGSGSRWARRDDPMTNVIIGFAASDRADRVHEANRWPNPWRAGSNFNRTRQTIIANLDPARAAILRAEAGH